MAELRVDLRRVAPTLDIESVVELLEPALGKQDGEIIAIGLAFVRGRRRSISTAFSQSDYALAMRWEPRSPSGSPLEASIE
jgi:hypothetical protein